VLSAILHAGLVVAAIASFKRKRAVFFGIALFYITLIVEASVFPISDVIVEHRVYLPSVGIFIAASSLIWLAAKRLHARRVSVWILVGALIALLTFMTHQRNGAWADSETIWGDNIAKEPTSFRAHYKLGKEYEYQKRWDEAKREWREAVKYRDSAWAWNNIANILLMEENHDEALKAFRKAIELNPTFAAPYANMGVIREKQGRYDESIELNRKAISIDPEFGKAYFNIGRAYIAKKHFVSAERALARAIELDPKNADVRFHMAIVMFRTGRGTEAVDQLREVIRISPDHRPSRNLMRELTKKGGGG